MEWTIPSPTLEKPMPAIYCASAMPLRATGSLPLSTAFFKCSAINPMAFSSNMSLIVHAPGVM